MPARTATVRILGPLEVRVDGLRFGRAIWVASSRSRYLARQIKGATLVELPGVDHDPWVGDSGEVLRLVEQFLGTLAGRATAASAP